MTRLVGLLLLSLLLVQYVTSDESLQRQERRAQRKQKALKPVPGCEWKLSECNPKKGRCGKGFQQAMLSGSGCPAKNKRIRCKIPCRAEAHGPIKGLSPSEAGLKGEAVSSSVSSLQNKPSKGRKCRYTKGEWSPCDPATNLIKRTLTLKRGDASVCAATKEIVKKCKKACKYSKGSWSECNPITNIKERRLTLKKGDPVKCEATRTVTRRCKNGKRGKKKKRKKKKKNRVGKAKGCKYTRAEWSECNLAANTRTRVLTLRKGDPSKCEAIITVTRKCKKDCKYTRGDWSPCNPITSVRSRTLTLRKGDPSTCENTKVVTRKCKKPCRYTRGQWSECDATKLLKTRVDQLKTGNSESICDRTRTVTKPCKIKDRSKCKYDISPWSPCNPITKERTREKVVIEGGPGCEDKKTIRRSCQKRNGEERCFFGPWGDFGECRNGVKTKIRTVLSGPDTCQRKAVKMKPCKRGIGN